MAKILEVAWVVKAVFKVHHEAMKSQKQDGGGGCLDVPDTYGRCESASDGESDNRRHIDMI